MYKVYITKTNNINVCDEIKFIKIHICIYKCRFVFKQTTKLLNLKFVLDRTNLNYKLVL